MKDHPAPPLRPEFWTTPAGQPLPGLPQEYLDGFRDVEFTARPATEEEIQEIGALILEARRQDAAR